MITTFSRSYALLITIDGDLPSTGSDVKGLHERLVDPSPSACPPQNVRLLTEQEANAKRIRGELKRLAQIIAAGEQQSTVIIYFSGYGWKVKSRSEDAFDLIPSEFNPDDLKRSALESNEFTALFTQIRSERFLLLLNRCHSGGLNYRRQKHSTKRDVGLTRDPRTLTEQAWTRLNCVFDGKRAVLGWSAYSAFAHFLHEAFYGEGNSRSTRPELMCSS